MRLVSDLEAVDAAVGRSGLRRVDASLPALAIEIDGEPDSVLDVLKDLGEGAAFVETLLASAPDLDETEERSAALIEEYRTRFGERPVVVTVACPMGGVIAGALFVLADWAEFDDRCDDAVREPAPPTEGQIEEWAVLCAEDDGFRRR
jgi:hypothetical protein